MHNVYHGEVSAREMHNDTVLPATYRFGPFILETATRRLRSGGESKPLTEKLFRILVLLLEARGQVVPKQDFFTGVWPNEQPSDANLTTHIYLLRQILGERADDEPLIVTLSGTGYRLAVAVDSKAGLNMKGTCELCGGPLSRSALAMICSYEYTYCVTCAARVGEACPDCGGELVRRPRRP